MDYAPANPGAGYTAGESAVIGVFRGTNFHLHGISILGKVPAPGDASLYAVSFARDYPGTAAGGHVSGCWIGVAPDGATISGAKYGITAFHHRDDQRANPAGIDNLTVGVQTNSPNPAAEFNVIVQFAIPIDIEGDGARVAGNFIGVLPDGLHDYNVALDPNYTGEFQFEGAIDIGQHGKNIVIGVDGDGVNDAFERNVIGGTLPSRLNGYDHTVELYSFPPSAHVIIAGNYIGVGIDGKTQFTNGVPAINAAGENASYRIGSDFDGVSDDLEGNVIANNFPSGLFPPAELAAHAEDLHFFDQIAPSSRVSFRGNSLINNAPFPAGPSIEDRQFLKDYYGEVLLTTTNGLAPALSTNTTAARLIGILPRGNLDHPVAILDLYAADPVGLTNGLAANIVNLPNGFVQGRRYLASFVEGSTNDLDPAPGAFSFDLTGIDLGGATNLTATATYSKAQPGTHNDVGVTSPFSVPVVISPAPSGGVLHISDIRVTNGAIQLAWSGGQGPYDVQQKLGVTNNWQNVATVITNRQATLPLGQAAAFFRVAGH
ncbi:MAG: hypothetical protein HY043_05795, partial [Verrucomicrobia bacterium]|nr:hypothetical protein [Verrucomicrobiota bacterium]